MEVCSVSLKVLELPHPELISTASKAVLTSSSNDLLFSTYRLYLLRTWAVHCHNFMFKCYTLSELPGACDEETSAGLG